MTGIVPELDDIAFDEMVEEARGLIPEFAPHWTDHNLHDPGITILELMAHLVDQQVYRIGFVGPGLRRAFTRLLGIVPEAACGARFEIWPFAGAVGAETELSAGTEIRTDDAPDGRFMLDADIRLVPRRIDGLTLVAPDGRTELGLGLIEGRSPLGLAPAAGGGPSSLEIQFDADPGAGEGPITLGVVVDAAPRGAAWDPVEVEEARPGGLWAPLRVEDGTAGLTRTGVLRIWPGAGRTWRLRLDRGQRPGDVTLGRLGLNVLSAREGWWDIEEAVTEGTGLPDHRVDFPLITIDAETPLVLESAGPGGIVTWTKVEEFDQSGPGDAHVRVDDQGLVFGNGVNGRVLAAGEAVRHRPLIRTEGAGGNVAPGLHWRVLGMAWGENLGPGRGGRDADTLASLIVRARAVAAARAGVLDADALAHRAADAGLGLARLEVMSGRRPGRMAGGSRTVLAIPARTATARPGPPRAGLMAELAAALDPARLLGERIYVVAPMYVDLDVSVTFAVRPDADMDRLRRALAARITARLWDIPRGERATPWAPGRPVSTGDVRALAADLPDVIRMVDCTLVPVDGRATPGGLIPLGDREFPLARNVSVVLLPEALP